MTSKPLSMLLKDPANSHYPDGDIQKALSSYNQILAHDPENATAYFHRGNLYADLSRSGVHFFHKSMYDYNRAIDLDPSNETYLYARGSLSMANNGFEEAMEDFDRVIEINPNFHHAYYKLGVILNQLGMRDCNMELGKAAIRYFQKAESLGNVLAANILNKI